MSVVKWNIMNEFGGLVGPDRMTDWDHCCLVDSIFGENAKIFTLCDRTLLRFAVFGI